MEAGITYFNESTRAKPIWLQRVMAIRHATESAQGFGAWGIPMDGDPALYPALKEYHDFLAYAELLGTNNQTEEQLIKFGLARDILTCIATRYCTMDYLVRRVNEQYNRYFNEDLVVNPFTPGVNPSSLGLTS